MYAFQAFQKSIESPFQFSKNARKFHSIKKTIGKRAQNIRKKIQPIEKRNQPFDAPAFLKTQMKFNSYLRTLHKYFKNE